MNAYDFPINFKAGLRLLQGLDPYSDILYRYPFPFTYFWALLALPGEQAMSLMLVVWDALILAMLVYAWRRNFWQWVFFFPFLHELYQGQVEMLFWLCERQMDRGKYPWRSALLGAFLTMKPQTALILLPWHLVDWLKHDRKMLLRWLLCTGLLWGVPLLWRPDWLNAWLGLRGSDANFVYSASVSNGVFTLLRLTGESLNPPLSSATTILLVILAVNAVVIYLYGQFQSNKNMAKACAMLGSPLGLFYTQMTLMGTAPWWLLVPVNWMAFSLCLIFGNFVPATLTPIAVIVWNVRQQKRKPRE